MPLVIRADTYCVLCASHSAKYLKGFIKALLYLILMTFLQDRSIAIPLLHGDNKVHQVTSGRSRSWTQSLMAEPLLPPMLHWVSTKIPSCSWCGLPAKIQGERNCYWTALGFAVHKHTGCPLPPAFSCLLRVNSLEESWLAQTFETCEAFWTVWLMQSLMKQQNPERCPALERGKGQNQSPKRPV